MGSREDGLPHETVGLGVTEAALTVFANFVDHIAANAATTSAATEKLQPPTAHLRRSKRFATRVEAPVPCPPLVPPPLEQSVRTSACVSCCNGRNLGFAPYLHGYRSRPAPRPRVPPWVHSWAPRHHYNTVPRRPVQPQQCLGRRRECGVRPQCDPPAAETVRSNCPYSHARPSSTRLRSPANQPHWQLSSIHPLGFPPIAVGERIHGHYHS